MTHASLFSGIGGSEVAAVMLGWQNLFHCEINPFGRAVLDYWFPNSKSYEDITNTDFSEWRGKVNVLTGGFPCQPFSYAGKRGGADDDRYLWPHMLRAIQEIRPTWVIGENVAGITTMVEQSEIVKVGEQTSLFGEENTLRSYELRQRFTLERICQDLECVGYSVQPIIVPACSVGAPHRRDRVFIIGHRRDAVAPNADLCTNGRNAGEDAGKGRAQWRAATEWSDRFYAILRHATDTESQQSERNRPKQSKSRRTESCQFGGGDSESDNIAGCGRWSGFPTVSPVHRGNDGIPFDVDNLSIPFNRWREESIKAYGNAIVPQVMYELFLEIKTLQQ